MSQPSKLPTESGLLTAEALLAAPDASNWIKDALRTAVMRDPIDAASDAALLAAVLGARADVHVAAELAKLGLPRPGGS